MATICFYQDIRHEQPLLWIRDTLGIGYISRRNDGITELRINGFSQVGSILKELKPYIRFKRLQAIALLNACDLLDKKRLSELSTKQLLELVEIILTIQNENYVTKRKKTREELCKTLGLTP